MELLILSLTMFLRWSSVHSTAIASNGLHQDYCQWEKFTATCGPDSIVVMETALYGRMKHTRCIKYNLGYIGCTADVLDIADLSCSGRRKCEITVPNESFDNAKTCMAELTCYMSASYRCQKVITADSFMCRSTNLVKVLPTSGFISNLVPGSRVGSADCGGDISPQWLIEAQPGQRINITLWDFARRRVDKQSLHHHHSSMPGCIKYATLTEDGPEVSSVPALRSKSVCGSNGLDSGRVTWVYESTSSALQVKMNALASTDGAASDAHHFLLEYHIIGCADLQVPDQAWFQRDSSSSARIGCVWPSGGDKSWTLTCNGTAWIGNIHHVTSCQPESSNLQVDNFRFPIATSVVVIISLSLLIGFIILMIGLLYLCRRWRHHAENVEVSAVCRAGATGDSHSDGTYIGGSSRLLVQQKAFGQLSMNVHEQRSVDDNIMIPTNRQVHRESNEYASIWEWPLPHTPASGTAAAGESGLAVGCNVTNRPDYEMSGSRDTPGGYYGTYETRQFNSSVSELSCRRVEHPYQHPGTPSSGRRCFIKDDVIGDKSVGRARYFDLNTELTEDSSSGYVVDVMSGTTGGVTGQIISAHGGRIACYSPQQYITAKPSQANKSSLTILN